MDWFSQGYSVRRCSFILVDRIGIEEPPGASADLLARGQRCWQSQTGNKNCENNMYTHTGMCVCACVCMRVCKRGKKGEREELEKIYN